MEGCYSFCHKPGKEEREQQQLKIYQSNYAKADAVQVFFIQYFTLNQRVKM